MHFQNDRIDAFVSLKQYSTCLGTSGSDKNIKIYLYMNLGEKNMEGFLP